MLSGKKRNRKELGIIMNITLTKVFGIVAVMGVVALVGCGQKTETPGVGERTVAALHRAAAKSP